MFVFRITSIDLTKDYPLYVMKGSSCAKPCLQRYPFSLNLFSFHTTESLFRIHDHFFKEFL